MFYEQQHGFLPRMSCVVQLVHKMEHWIKSLDDGNDARYCLLGKAFDCVPQQRVLSKLKAYGMSGNVLNWIMDFLSNR